MEPNIPVGSEAGVAERDEAGGGRRRARAARGRQRQVGGALEDGAHRAAGLGEGRGRQPARAGRSRRSPTPPPTPTALVQLEPAPRTVRGARDLLSVALQYGNAFGQGLAGGGAEAGRLLRQRRRALPDGGHGHRRDPPVHPVGVAAQAAPRFTEADPATASARGTRSPPTCSSACCARSTPSCWRPATATSTTTRRPRRCRSPREIVRTYVTAAVKAPWYIDLLNINLDNHDLAKARRRIAALHGDLRARRHPHHREPRLRGAQQLPARRSQSPMSAFESEVAETARWFASPRFEGITRLYSARQVVEQRGTIPADYTVARVAAEQFYDRLRAAVRRAQADHHLRALFSRAGGGAQAGRASRASTSAAGPPRPRGRPTRIPGPTWPATR